MSVTFPTYRRFLYKSDFDEIRYTTSDIEPDYSHVTKNYNFLNSRWRLPPSWKSFFFGHKSLTDCPISAKFCMRKQNSRSTSATWQKLHIFKFQHGGRPPFWKSLNRHMSVKNRPILMKFGTLHHILNAITVTWPKITIFWNLRWRLPPSWKSLFWPLLINGLSDFSEILYEKAERHADKRYGKNANV